MNKPYSESCDQNKAVIHSVISQLFSSCKTILEIGSGTGQHAVYFAEKMQHLVWHTSDCLPYLDGIKLWLNGSGLQNVMSPFELDVTSSVWPVIEIDAVFTANTFHIMHQQDIGNFMSGVGKLLKSQGTVTIYGPFNYGGQYTSASNESFDRWLKNRDPSSGIKHFEEVKSLAAENGMQLSEDYEMPENNRILHFTKS